MHKFKALLTAAIGVAVVLLICEVNVDLKWQAAQRQNVILAAQLESQRPLVGGIHDFAAACKEQKQGLTVAAIDVDGQYIALVCVQQ